MADNPTLTIDGRRFELAGRWLDETPEPPVVAPPESQEGWSQIPAAVVEHRIAPGTTQDELNAIIGGIADPVGHHFLFECGSEYPLTLGMWNRIAGAFSGTADSPVVVGFYGDRSNGPPKLRGMALRIPGGTRGEPGFSHVHVYGLEFYRPTPDDQKAGIEVSGVTCEGFKIEGCRFNRANVRFTGSTANGLVIRRSSLIGGAGFNVLVGSGKSVMIDETHSRFGGWWEDPAEGIQFYDGGNSMHSMYFDAGVVGVTVRRSTCFDAFWEAWKSNGGINATDVLVWRTKSFGSLGGDSKIKNAWFIDTDEHVPTMIGRVNDPPHRGQIFSAGRDFRSLLVDGLHAEDQNWFIVPNKNTRGTVPIEDQRIEVRGLVVPIGQMVTSDRNTEDSPHKPDAVEYGETGSFPQITEAQVDAFFDRCMAAWYGTEWPEWDEVLGG